MVLTRRVAQSISRRLRLVSRRPVCGSSRISPVPLSHPHAASRPCPHHAARDRVRGAWSSRPTKCPAQGGAGSKRFLLGCDPEAGHGRAFMRRSNARLRGRIPTSGARRRAEEGPLWGCAPDSVSRSVVREGAHGGVWMRWCPGAYAAAPANGPAANVSQPPPSPVCAARRRAMGQKVGEAARGDTDAVNYPHGKRHLSNYLPFTISHSPFTALRPSSLIK